MAQENCLRWQLAVIALLSVTAFANHSKAAWIDAATGTPVKTIPIGSPDPLANSRNSDPNHATVGGKNLYWDDTGGAWRDAATGAEVRTVPVGSPDPFMNARSGDPNHATVGGKNLFWQPVATSATPARPAAPAQMGYEGPK